MDARRRDGASGHLAFLDGHAHDHLVAAPLPIVYREEVLTIMGVIGDIRFELQRIREALEDEDEEEEEAGS